MLKVKVKVPSHEIMEFHVEDLTWTLELYRLRTALARAYPWIACQCWVLGISNAFGPKASSSEILMMRSLGCSNLFEI